MSKRSLFASSIVAAVWSSVPSLLLVIACNGLLYMWSVMGYLIACDGMLWMQKF